MQLIMENWRGFVKEVKFDSLTEEERKLIEEGMIKDAWNWIKAKPAKIWQDTKDFLKNLHQEWKETKEGIMLINTMMAGADLSKEQQQFVIEQFKDVSVGSALLGVVALPGGGIALKPLLWVFKKAGIDLRPSAFREPDPPISIINVSNKI